MSKNLNLDEIRDSLNEIENSLNSMETLCRDPCFLGLSRAAKRSIAHQIARHDNVIRRTFLLLAAFKR